MKPKSKSKADRGVAPPLELQPAQHTFVAECRELLRDMEDALLRLEKAPGDGEAVNAVFRAAHTIKGSSGVFGFDAIVAFTHGLESVIEDVRAGDVAVDADLIALLLSCGDHVALLVEAVAGGEAAPDESLSEAGATLAAQLAACTGAIAEPFPVAVAAPEPQAQVESLGGGGVASDTWHISLRFGRDVLRNGLDPLSFIRYLGTLGEVAAIATLFEAMPEAASMDPESCYLGVEIDFAGEIDKAALEDAFEFLRDDCAIRILPPHSHVGDYIRLIEELPEDKAMLGELLVRSGALTDRELEEGLKLQRALDEDYGQAADHGHAHKLGEILVGQGVVQNELVDAALEKQRTIQEHRARESHFVRVRADKLDELITLVGELVIAGAGTRLLALRAGLGDLIESTSTMERLVEEIRDGALSLRMVPIAETFGRFKRVVRDLGRELGKEVELVLSGTDTEVDKSMAERIGDPLMHLVRNALDHGIEPPEVRVQRGKPACGRIHLNAYHDSGVIVVEVNDDGGGLDRRRILETARVRGLVAPGQEPDEKELLDLVMEPGFSTAGEVTNVSGRGIGMDVVRRNVEALRGAVAIDSVDGQGTTVSIRLPLTLAIIDGFLVGVGGSGYVVPLEMVVECMELGAEDRAAIASRSYINLRGRVLPLLRLREVFEVPGEAGRRENIVVVQYAGRQAGFVVDSLVGEFQTVIKPLGKLFERLSGISGSTILGSGEVALIVDVPHLVQRATGEGSRREGVPPLARNTSISATPHGEAS